MFRNQRQQALNVMRTVNEAFVLPNPPTWRQKIRKAIEKSIIGLRKVFGNQKREPLRVSWHNHDCTVESNS